MNIVLMRHGKPLIRSVPIPARDFGKAVEAYDRAGLDTAVSPPEGTRDQAATSSYIISSDLPRAIESARMLGSEHPAESDPLFREAVLPMPPSLPFKLDPHAWAVIARVDWYLGFSRSDETVSQTRDRAKRAVRYLEDLAAVHGSVLLAGHMIFNTFIARELRANAWSGPRIPSTRYWSTSSFRK
jgi:broad specificity phosphatase PhoE